MSASLRTCLGMSLVLAIFCVGFSAYAQQTAEELQQKINENSTKIDALNREIAGYQVQLTSLGGKKQTLQNTLSTLELTRKKLTAQIELTKRNITVTEGEVRKLEQGIADKEDSIGQNKEAIAETLRGVFERDSQSLAEGVLGESGVSAIWDDVERISDYQVAVKKSITELLAVKQTLANNKTATEEKRKVLIGQRNTLANEQQSLAIATREQRELLAQTKSQESSYQKLLADKKAAKAQFEKEMDELESKLKYVLDPSTLPTGKGILRWPLDVVTITQNFGNTAFAKSGAYNGKGHNGIDLRAAVGTPLKAALAGTVMGTGNTDATRGCYSYGKWVLIKHANGLATLYAHMSQISVAKGELVGTGQVIGYTGSTGYATGPHLHFSVYANDGVRIVKMREATGRVTACGEAMVPIAPYGAYLNPIEYL